MAVEITAIEVNVGEIVEVSQVQPVIEVEVAPVAGTYEVVAETDTVVESSVTQFIEVEVGIPGPPGPPGPSAGENVPYAKRTDFVGDSTIYKGEAEPGSLETDAVWRISKITFIGEDASEQWAAGNAGFTNVWADRLSLAYI